MLYKCIKLAQRARYGPKWMPIPCVDGAVQLELGPLDDTTMLQERNGTMQGTDLDYADNSPLKSAFRAGVFEARLSPFVYICTTRRASLMSRLLR